MPKKQKRLVWNEIWSRDMLELIQLLTATALTRLLFVNYFLKKIYSFFIENNFINSMEKSCSFSFM